MSALDRWNIFQQSVTSSQLSFVLIQNIRRACVLRMQWVRGGANVTVYRANLSMSSQWTTRAWIIEGKNSAHSFQWRINSFHGSLPSLQFHWIYLGFFSALHMIPHDLGRHNNLTNMYLNKLLGITKHKNRRNTRSIAQNSHSIVHDFLSIGPEMRWRWNANHVSSDSSRWAGSGSFLGLIYLTFFRLSGRVKFTKWSNWNACGHGSRIASLSGSASILVPLKYY